MGMRRAERLFRLLQILRRQRRPTTARVLAEELEVSVRTVYRDVQELLLSGIPLRGEAGVGYLLSDFDLPPLMFTPEEIEALVLGARIVKEWMDPSLSRAAEDVMRKVESVLPQNRRPQMKGIKLFVPPRRADAPGLRFLAEIRSALREERKLALVYHDANDDPTERIIRPLGMAFFGWVWMLTGWCELRQDFRNFRPDRIQSLELLEKFSDEPGKTLEDYLRPMESGETSGFWW